MFYGYKEIRKLPMDKIRAMCIENGYYTCGDCEEYDNMLTNADAIENVTTDNIVEIADDIAEHSDHADVENVMWQLASVSVTFFERT